MTELRFNSQADFARALGITPGGLSDVLRAKSGVGVSDKIKRSLERSYGININWLESGEGEIRIAQNKHNETHKIQYNPPSQNQSIEDQLSQLRQEFLEKERMYRELIAEKDKRLAEKDELIMVLREQIAGKRAEQDTTPGHKQIPKELT